MFKLHTKKIYTKYDKVFIFEKSPHENYHGEKKSWAEWSGISLLFSKSMPWLFRVYIGSFFNLHTSSISPRWEIDETFGTFGSCYQIFVAIWHPIFKWEKRNAYKHPPCRRGRAHEACLQWPSLVHWEGVDLTLPPHIFSVQVKSRSMLHHGSVWASLKQSKKKLKKPNPYCNPNP